MGWLFTLLVVVAAAWWVIRRFVGARDHGSDGFTLRAHVFKIRFLDGRTVNIDGRIPRNALHAFEDIASRHELTGEVRGLGGNELRFTPSIPEGVQQQLRNAYFAAASVH